MNQKTPEPPQLSFDFVGDEGLRTALTRDAQELAIAAAGGAHKSTVVLAGSIIETVLLDHLVSTDHATRTGSDPTKFEFHKLIDVCHDEGVISDRTQHLLHAVRDYRNLIHPGRSMRLKDQVTPASATVAQGVVGIVCTEIAERPNRRFGMTAEQVLTKVRHDPKIVDMLDHILPELRASELDRLVLQTIPQAFLEAPVEEEDEETIKAVEQLYRSAFVQCSETARTTRIANLCQAIQSEPGWKVRVLLTHTFVGWHLQHASQEQQKLIVDRLLVESRGSSAPFPRSTYEYLLNVLAKDAAIKFLAQIHTYAHWWSDHDKNMLANNLLTDPQHGHYPPLDGVAAADHYAELVATLTPRAQRASTSGNKDDYGEWLKVLLEAADFPF